MKVQCLKLFNEQGLYIMPGLAEVSDQLGSYLLSNWPAYFTAVPSTLAAGAVADPVWATLDVSSSPDSGRVSPGAAGQSGGVEQAALTEGPPADKAAKAHRTRRKAI